MRGAWCSLFAVCWLLVAVWCLLFVGCCVLCVVCCVLFVVCCLLCVEDGIVRDDIVLFAESNNRFVVVCLCLGMGGWVRTDLRLKRDLRWSAMD